MYTSSTMEKEILHNTIRRSNGKIAIKKLNEHSKRLNNDTHVFKKKECQYIENWIIGKPEKSIDQREYKYWDPKHYEPKQGYETYLIYKPTIDSKYPYIGRIFTRMDGTIKIVEFYRQKLEDLQSWDGCENKNIAEILLV